jgi:hypothetical protein
MPGVSDKGFDVTIADDMLTIKSEKHSEKCETDKKERDPRRAGLRKLSSDHVPPRRRRRGQD